MSLDSVLAEARAAAAELMVDEVDFYRPGEDVFDRDTGLSTPGPRVVTFYAGAARVKPENTTGREVDAGEQNVTLRGFTVSLPWDAEMPSGFRPRPGDLVDVTASPDARLVGLTLWVTGVQYSATATVWRINAEDRS